MGVEFEANSLNVCIALKADLRLVKNVLIDSKEILDYDEAKNYE